MATDWAAEALGAYNDIKEDGVAVTIRKHTYTTYDPKTDAATGGTIDSTDTYCLITAFKDGYNEDVKAQSQLKDKTSVKRGDRMLLVAAYGLYDIANPPEKTTYDIVFQDNIHTIVAVEVVEPGGYPILYRVHARR
jgi:hypothetical protein